MEKKSGSTRRQSLRNATTLQESCKENVRKQKSSAAQVSSETTFSCSFNAFDPDLLSAVENVEKNLHKETLQSNSYTDSKKQNSANLSKKCESKEKLKIVDVSSSCTENKGNNSRRGRKRKSNENDCAAIEKDLMELDKPMNVPTENTAPKHNHPNIRNKQQSVQNDAAFKKSLFASESPTEVKTSSDIMCTDSQSPEILGRRQVVRDSPADCGNLPRKMSLGNEDQNNIRNRLNDSSSKKKNAAEMSSYPLGSSSLPTDKLLLSAWGLPDIVLKQYEKCGITKMFEWQAECLCQGDVLNGGNLVYSAPTSAGKTLVAELLILKRVLETRRKAIVILPFVSVTREKMFYFQQLFQDVGIRVSGFMGSHRPAGGFKNVDVAVCTIEKGNSLINRLMEEDNLHKIGIIVVDELHMIGDTHRGYLLELLLTKIRYVINKKQAESTKQGTGEETEHGIQIVGMSATLPNLDLLSNWLKADLYHTDFRPVPLTECVKIGTAVYDTEFKMLREVDVSLNLKQDDDHIVPLCLETITNGHSILIFCPTKNWCEKLSETVAREFYNILTGQRPPNTNDGFIKASDIIQLPLDRDALRGAVEQLRRTPAGLDSVLGRTVYYGVAYHHAGLTFDERDIVEGSFRQGIIKVLIATSTLSSGVNLPARRVIIRSPTFHGKIIDTLVYKQMVGRAGRKGVDTAGESILICKHNEKNKAQTLLNSALPAVKSCLIKDNEELGSSLKRAILEIVVSGVAANPSDVATYTSCTMLAASFSSDDQKMQALIQSGIDFLEDNEFVCLKTVKDNDGNATERFYPTQLGSAVLASALSPDEGLIVFAELQKARKCFVLENELHIIYLVTPIYMQDVSANIDWFQYYSLWERLSVDQKRVAELVGVSETFLTRAIGGKMPTRTDAQIKSLAIHRRFFTALVLNDLVNEVTINEVARKFGCNKGQLQSLQQSAATFAGMVTVFCARLGWSCLELLLSQFQDRLTFGIQRELCDLVRISLLTGQSARTLYNAGYQTVAELACACPTDLEAILSNSSPFQSNKKQGNESQWEVEERKKIRCIWLTGRKGVTEYEAAVAITDEAKSIIQAELGVAGVKWHDEKDQNAHNDSDLANTTDASMSSGGNVSGKIKNRSLVFGNSRHKLNKTLSKSSLNVSDNSEQNISLNSSKMRPNSSFIINPFSKKTIKTPVASIHSSEDQVCSAPCAEAQGAVQTCSSSSGKVTDIKTVEEENEAVSSCLAQNLDQTNPLLDNKETNLKGVSCRDPHPSTSGFDDKQSVEVVATVHRVASQRSTKCVKNKDDNRDHDIHCEKSIKTTNIVDQKNSIDDSNAEDGEAIALGDKNFACTNDSREKENENSANETEGNVQYEDISKLNCSQKLEPNSAVCKKLQSAIQHFGIPSPVSSVQHCVIGQNELVSNLDLVQKPSNLNEIPFEPDCSDLELKLMIIPTQNTDKSFMAIYKEGSSGLVEVNEFCDEKNVDCEKVTENDLSDNQFELNLSPSCDLEIDSFHKIMEGCNNETDKKSQNSSPNISDDFVDSFVIDTQTDALIGKSVKRLNSAKKSDSENVDVNEVYKDLFSPNLYSENMFSDESPEMNEKNKKHSLVPQESSFQKQEVAANIDDKQSSDSDESFNLVPASNYERESYNEEYFVENDGVKALNLDSSYCDIHVPFLTGQQNCGSDNDVNAKFSKKDSADDEFHDDIAIALNMSDSFSIENLSSVTNGNKNKSRRDDTGCHKIKTGVCSTTSTEFHTVLSPYREIEQYGTQVTTIKPLYSTPNVANKHVVDHFSSPFSSSQADALLTDCGLQLQKMSKQENVQTKTAVMKTSRDKNISALKQIPSFPKCHSSNEKLKSHQTSSTLSKQSSPETLALFDSLTNTSGSPSKPPPKRLPKPDLSRTPKHQKINAPGYSTPAALLADELRNNRNLKSAQCQKSSTAIEGIPLLLDSGISSLTGSKKQENPQKGRISADFRRKHNASENIDEFNGQISTDQDSLQNISNGSDCVPPTPPDEKSAFQSPKISIRTPKRDKMSTVKSKKTNQNQQNSHVKEQEQSSMISSTNRFHNVHRTTPENDCQSIGEKKLSSSSDSEILLTQDSISIIDVCSDQHLFETFIEEWRNKSRFSVSVACERKPREQADVQIGMNFMKNERCDIKASRRNDVEGFPVGDRDIVIVGVAVSWENRDAYYVSLTTKSLESDMNDSLAPPQLDNKLTVDQRMKSIKPILEKGKIGRKAISVIAFDVKSQYAALVIGCGIALEGLFEDPKIADWLTDPSGREKNLHRLVTNCLPAHVQILEGIGGGIGVGSLGMSTKNPGTGRCRAVTESILSFHLMDYFRQSLKDADLYKAFTEVEMPAVIALSRMELNGFGFSHNESEKQKNIMTAKLNALEGQAYQLAGHPFSLTSTDDISQVLYIELKLPVNGDPNTAQTRTLGVNRRPPVQRRGKQKPQFSTSKDILEKLKPFHGLPGVILEWRRISNALTKVVFPLQKESIYTPKLDMQRIYSECQLHTATGRVSLQEPNIQNTPKDFDISLPDLIGESPENNPNMLIAKRFTNKKAVNSTVKRLLMSESRQHAKITGENKPQSFCVSMRHAFIPFKGGVLLAADYSQLELRMIAYLSNDRKLMKILNGNEDVFKQIAAEWKNMSAEDVTAESRQQAKQVCYGMIYGIGPKALGEQIGVDENDAVVFIETFKSKYPGMKKYLRETVEFCRENGYVKTMYGRKRFLPSIKDMNPHARAQAERQAVNTTVQGSAADLVKVAMIKIDIELKLRFPACNYTHRHVANTPDMKRRCSQRSQVVPSGAYLVLQLHDELIYEVAQDDLVDVTEIIQRNMETAIKLPVKMPVKVKVGPSWGRLEEIQL